MTPPLPLSASPSPPFSLHIKMSNVCTAAWSTKEYIIPQARHGSDECPRCAHCRVTQAAPVPIPVTTPDRLLVHASALVPHLSLAPDPDLDLARPIPFPSVRYSPSPTSTPRSSPAHRLVLSPRPSTETESEAKGEEPL